jgi:hypothetical protein
MKNLVCPSASAGGLEQERAQERNATVIDFPRRLQVKIIHRVDDVAEIFPNAVPVMPRVRGHRYSSCGLKPGSSRAVSVRAGSRKLL